MDSSFRFKRFSVSNERSALKVGTDAVLLGAAMTLRQSDRRLLDIGTGTGVIALMVAQRLSGMDVDCHVHAIDIDPPSAQEAADNFAASPWPGCLSAECIALQQFEAGVQYDHIFSNPPYFDSSLRNPDERESNARHTDMLSYRDICAFAAERLSPEGVLSLILPADCEKMLVRTAASFGLFPFRLLDIRTTPRKPVKRLIVEFSRTKTLPEREELVLQDGNSRSEAYAFLTKDFYL